MRLLVILLLGLTALLFSSCAHPRGNYKGYKNGSYTVRGQTYYPMSVDQALHYEEVGTASWFNESRFFGLKRGNTAIGEKVMPWHKIAAHKTLPLPSVVKVTNLENGKSVKCRVNDRGPFIAGRIIDLSPRAAKKIGFYDQGLTTVEVEVLSVGDGKYKRKPRRRKFLGIF
ncbi:septal ring lytic transglycosylase RlpA family protein [Haloferula sp. A504]|uniref:septal ring lytic transglycosylase RlpA family protein n=1 Tax=Haloferula sp. A504 TaxID=3373601 RepID=UPI0031C222D2|nr:septal ring lytic transglycosylase RlpA family protein [Verrucomicrobiaceae bacterium E54]